MYPEGKPSAAKSINAVMSRFKVSNCRCFGFHRPTVSYNISHFRKTVSSRWFLWTPDSNEVDGSVWTSATTLK